MSSHRIQNDVLKCLSGIIRKPQMKARLPDCTKPGVVSYSDLVTFYDF